MDIDYTAFSVHYNNTRNFKLTAQMHWLLWKCYKQLIHASAVRMSRYEALGKFEEHSRG